MTLLSIFDFGAGWLALLTIAFLAPAGFLFWQAKRQAKQMSERQYRPLPGEPILDTTGAPIKLKKLWTFRLACILVGFWLVSLLAIHFDFAKPKNYIPVEQLNDGRIPAEDMIKK